jgi:hypothetical protein
MSRLLELTSSTPTGSDTICGYGVMGSMKASTSEKEDMIGWNDMARSRHQRWRKRAGGRIGKKM